MSQSPLIDGAELFVAHAADTTTAVSNAQRANAGRCWSCARMRPPAVCRQHAHFRGRRADTQIRSPHPSTIGSNPCAHRRHELDAGRGLPAARRPRHPALGSTEQHSHLRLTVDCILPERVAADAAEPLGIPVFPVVPYGVTPYFREFPGLHLAPGRDAPARRARHPRRHGPQRLPPHPDRQRARRQQRRAAVRAGVGRRSRRLPSALPQLVERAAHVGQGAGDRSRRVARVVDGELPVDAPSGHRHAVHAAHHGRSRPRPRARSGRAARSTSATATTAACINAPTRTCSRSGRSRSRKRARCSTAPGAPGNRGRAMRSSSGARARSAARWARTSRAPVTM